MKMNKEELLALLICNGELVPKRCTESYLTNHNLMSVLDELTPKEFGSVSDRIKLLRYGGGYCEVCGIRTKISVTGKGFGKYCKEHFHEPKKNILAHNRKEFDLTLAIKYYNEDKLPLIEVANLLNISNVTLANRFKANNIEIRSHSENQKLFCKRNYTKPNIIIDRTELVAQYNSKIPIKTLAEKYNCHEETIRRFLIQENVARSNRRSYIEQKVISLLDEISVKYTINNRKLIKPLEIDIFLPDHNIGIELNGLYTHSSYTGNKDKNYHHNKFIQTQAIGVKLYQFWENDINERFPIITSMLLNSLNHNNTKVDARKCIIKDIDWNTLSSFCVDNHIQGSPGKNVSGKGLLYNETLVAVIGYRIIEDVTVINRFCSLLNHNVRGGFSKLLNSLSGSIIKTYSSNDIGNGNLYSSNGFNCTKEFQHDLWYTDYNKMYNREKFMKNKLPKLLEIYDNTKTEIENMLINGYDTIYKSGTKTWVLYR